MFNDLRKTQIYYLIRPRERGCSEIMSGQSFEDKVQNKLSKMFSPATRSIVLPSEAHFSKVYQHSFQLKKLEYLVVHGRGTPVCREFYETGNSLLGVIPTQVELVMQKKCDLDL